MLRGLLSPRNGVGLGVGLAPRSLKVRVRRAPERARVALSREPFDFRGKVGRRGIDRGPHIRIDVVLEEAAYPAYGLELADERLQASQGARPACAVARKIPRPEAPAENVTGVGFGGASDVETGGE